MITGPLGARHDAVVIVVREDIAKSAALCFDAIVPIGTDRVPKEVLAWGAPESWQHDASRLYSAMIRKVGALPGATIGVYGPDGNTYAFDGGKARDDETTMAGLLETLYLNSERLRQSIAHQLEAATFSGTPLLLPESFENKSSVLTDAAISIALQGVDLIDVDGLSWEDIVDLRKDSSAMRGLRAYRDLLVPRGTSVAKCAEDDLSRAIDRYRSVAQSHGLRLITGNVGVVIAADSGRVECGSSLLPFVFGDISAGFSMNKDGKTRQVSGVQAKVSFANHDIGELTINHPQVFTLGTRIAASD